MFGVDKSMIQWGFRSADIGDCHLFVVPQYVEFAQCCWDAYEDKIMDDLSGVISWLNK